MRTVGKSGLALGLLTLATAAFLPMGVASADTDPALAGDCANTLGADPGQALTLDVGAPLNEPHRIMLGTGSNSANNPTLSLDVTGLTGALGVTNVPGVTTVCDGVQGTVNALSDTTQTLIGGNDGATQPPPTQPKPPTSPSPKPKPPSSSEPPATQPGGGDASALLPDGFTLVSFPLTPTAPDAGPDTSLIVPPGSIAPPALGVVPPSGTMPGPATQDSGTALALPAAQPEPAKLPLLLAAIALAVVGALLAHVWLRRRPQ